MELDVIFNVPPYVQHASADSLNPQGADALTVSGYRIDNQAAAWVSAALMKKASIEGRAISKTAYDKVQEACKLFGITNQDFQLKDVAAEHCLVKKAGCSAEFVIYDEPSFHDAVNTLMQKRASYPAEFCRECARELVRIADQYGYTANGKENRLEKMAGMAHPDSDRCRSEIRKRIQYAAIRHMDKEVDALHKLSNMCEDLTDQGTLFADAMVDAIDTFDQGCGLIHKLAYEGMLPAEEAVFLSNEEFLRKKANTPVALDSKRSVKSGVFMNSGLMEQISKWASSCGVVLKEYATVEEAASVIGSMPEPLKCEFIERFANAV